MGVPPNIWEYPPVYGSIPQYMGVPTNLWEYPPIYGSTPQYMDGTEYPPDEALWNREWVLNAYSSGQSHFSEINAKLAGKNEIVTHFVQNCLETRENEQNVVLKWVFGSARKPLGNRSDVGICYDNSWWWRELK